MRNTQLLFESRRPTLGVSNPAGLDWLTELARRLGLPDADSGNEVDWALGFADDRLQLQRRDGSGEGPVWAEPAPAGDRPLAGLTRRQPLARALGRKARRVVDATAGLGADSFLIAGLGLAVTAVERSPVIAALLEDGLRRARMHTRLGAVARRIELVQADARHWLLSCRQPPDVVYMDPMFPVRRRRSALPVKELRALRELVGEDPDAAELLAIARRVARQRVVVKRPGYAEPLAPAPDISYKGKLVRYDVYLCHPE